MSNKILQLYRQIYRQCLKIPKQEYFLTEHYKLAIRNRITNIKPIINEQKNIKTKQQILLLEAFCECLKQSNMKTPEFTFKLIKIYSNCSIYLTPNLQIRQNLVSSQIQLLLKDPKFQKLAAKDQKYVQNIVKQVCLKKKADKKIEQILQSLTDKHYQNHELQTIYQNCDKQEQLLEKIRKKTPYWKFYQQILYLKNDKKGYLPLLLEQLQQKCLIVN